MNNIALRNKVIGVKPFPLFLEQVKQNTLNALSHQELSFDRVVAEAGVPTNSNTPSIFQVALAFNPYSSFDLNFSGLHAKEKQASLNYSEIDLTLFISDSLKSEGHYKGEFRYNSDLFTKETIQSFFVRLEEVINRVTHNPNLPLKDYVAPPENEIHTIERWNDTKTLYEDRNETLTSLFETTAKDFAKETALVFEDKELNFEDLNKKANQLAHCLQKAGVQKESFVGLCLERSFEMVTSLLATNKALAAYAPIDPSFPESRIQQILEDCQAPVILTQKKFAERLKKVSTAHIICLDSDWESQVGLFPTENLSEKPSSKDLAYAIFTSGSTGKPKGAMIEHGSIMNRLLWMKEHYNFRSADRFIQKTPYTFDVSQWEFFAPLLVGAPLVIARPEGHKDPDYLVDLISKQSVNIIHFVPSMLSAFLDSPKVKQSASYLEKVFCSGEELPASLRDSFFKLFPNTLLSNLYGPTEAAVDVTYWDCQREDSSQTVPIGYPVANTQTYILDRYLNPTPIGVAGELHLGGVQVGRGYLNREELTKEKFIDDPFSPGQKLYKTGDLARYGKNGAIEFLGRIDHQVKIRGLRVELGEIEAHIRESAKEAVVVAPKGESGERILACYLVPQGPWSEEALVNALKDSLPEYMIPQVFIPMEELPTNHNGKVDRKALPSLEDFLFSGEVEAPESFIEKKIHKIWEELLKLNPSQFGVQCNFFKIGGNSIQTIKLASQLQVAFNKEVSVRNIFDHPNIRDLAQFIENSQASYEAIPVATNRESFPTSYAQERIWAIQGLNPQSSAYHVNFGFKAPVGFNTDVFTKALTTLVERHEVLRTHFQSEKLDILQKVDSSFELDISINPDGFSLDEFFNKPFDLQSSPLMRTYLRQASNSWDIYFSIHHIIFDEWSAQVFIDELSSIYHSYLEGQEVKLPSLPVQYGDYAQFERTLDISKLAYWKKRLDGSNFSLEFPTDKARPSLATDSGNLISFQLNSRLSSGLEDLAKKEGVTAFSLFFAAFNLLIHKYSGENNFCIGTPITLRDRKELERTMGMFLNSLPINTNFQGESFQSYIQSFHQQLVEDFDHKEVPFDQIVQHVSHTRDGRPPLFQVMFVFNEEIELSQTQALGFEPLANEIPPKSKFDFTFYFQKREGNFALDIEYNTDLFHQETMDNFGKRFIQVAEQVLENDQKAIQNYSCVLPEEISQMKSWNATERPYDLKNTTLTSIFESRVAQTPESTALIFEDQSLSYYELNKKSNQLAHYLKSQGVNRETYVAIGLDRSFEMIISLLGINKALGAFVPLDPGFPEDRLRNMLEDTQPQVFITQKKYQDKIEKLSEFTGVILYIDEDWDQWVASQLEENPVDKPQWNDMAYTIFTSGSTGRPKGAIIEQYSIANRLLWMEEAYKWSAQDRFLQKTPYTFDVSLFEFYMPLLLGAPLVIAKPEGHKDPAYLADLILDKNISIVHFVPSMLSVFLDSKEAKRCEGVIRKVYCTGEELPGILRDQFFETYKTATLTNLYGPTEAAVEVTYWDCERNSDSPSVPIGHPMSNTQIHILDKYDQPLPIGVPGELHIGGVQVGRGYLNRDELSKERFIPDPFSEGRLYRTGDLCKYRADGAIDFLGRLDNQIKIRGLRVELGEIEGFIRSVPEVKEVVVMAPKSPSGEMVLVGYIVAGDQWDEKSARNFLATQLPDYMIPQIFINLESMPLNSSGKVDRKALPKIEDSFQASEYVEAQDEVQRKLVETWKELLAVDRVGIHDNFFKLGGNSILLIKMNTLVSEYLKQDIPVTLLFEYPTIAELSAKLSSFKEDEQKVESQKKAKITDRGQLKRQAMRKRRSKRPH